MKIHHLLPLAFVAATLSADGAVIATESFDYGASSQPLVGRAGGSGFSSPWGAVSTPGVFTYTPAGLNFSDLLVTGGAASSVSGVGPTAVGNVNRRFATPLSGVVWGSFLVRLATRPSNVPVQSFIIGNAGDTDVTGTMAFQSDEYAQGPGAIRMENTSVLLSGSPLLTGETYLFLFKAEFAATQRATAWILSASQFDTFKADGLTEAELDLAMIGTGAGDVTERG